MAVTPLIKKISNPNGTFIAFQSAINDSNLISSQQGYQFSFSKYALIKIPEIKKAEIDASAYEEGSNSSGISDKNFFNIDAIGDKFNSSDSEEAGRLTKEFTESFQNYCLNLEATILTSVDKSASLNANVSEEIFFKWLKESGAIRFEEAQTGELGYARKNLDKKRFMEPVSEKDSEYSRVVKYINGISAVNVTMDGSVYTEVYIYTPTDHGQSPVVLFTSGDNKFYTDRMSYVGKSEYICGRDENSEHPDNLDMEAIYDADMDGASDVTNYIFNETTGEWEEGSWYDKYIGKTSTGYYFVDEIGSTEDLDIMKTSENGRSVKFRRSSLDGIKIDWNVSDSYSLSKLGVTDEEVSNFTLNEFNTVGGGECREFDFNAVLLYYDLTDSTGKSNSYLYGIYFLNKVDSDTNNVIAKIPCTTKYRSNSLETIEGNALGYKINLRTDTSFDNLTNISTSTASRNFSMDLFHESLSAMKIFSDSLNDKIMFITNLYNELYDLKKLFIDDQNKDEILARLGVLESEFHNFKKSVLDDNAVDISFVANLSDYVNDLYKKYNNIMSNMTPISVEYDYNPYKLNSMVVHNQAYNIDQTSYKRNIFDDGGNEFKLNKFANYYKHYVDEEKNQGKTTIEVDTDYDLYIIDNENSWVAGQTFKLVFDSDVVIEDGAQIRIFTDYKNVSNNGSLGLQIAEMNNTWFEEKYSGDVKRPIIEIVCIDPINMIFDVNQIK